MNDSFLLSGATARLLYEDHAKALPIVDYHNHINATDVQTNKKFEDLTELWLAPDPYKHRLMRISGIPEQYITGDASPREKFRKFASVFPYLVGNPVYDWSLMELATVFDVNEIPSSENADRIYDTITEMLGSEEYRCGAILSRFGIRYQSPVAGILDDLSPYSRDGFAPSLRGDNLLAPTKALIADLACGDNGSTTLDSYLAAIAKRLDQFSAAGCKFADHALDDGFAFIPDDGANDARLARLLGGEKLTEQDSTALKSAILARLGAEYAKRNYTLLLHLDAKRKTSNRLARLAGPAGGYAAVGGSLRVSHVVDLLSAMEDLGGLPKTVLFPLDMKDHAAISVLEGSFSEDHVAAKVELGPAWWWCDHRLGMINTFECISSFGVLSEFIGMTTDSRSILSFVRHDYFRRVLCSWLGEKYDSGIFQTNVRTLGEIVEKISYKNALRRIGENK